MKFYKFVGDYGVAYFDLEKVESLCPFSQILKDHERNSVTTFFLTVNLSPGNYVKLSFASAESRDHAIDKILQALEELDKDKKESKSFWGGKK